MKYIILVLSVILFSSCKSFHNQEQQGYKIYKIENRNPYYVIYGEKDGQKYKIISEQQNDKTINKYKKYKKIKIGESYNLELNLYNPSNNDKNPLTNTSTTPYVIRCYMFTNTKICEEEGIKLYTTENIKGLYHIK